jgi:hypothetical protein
MNSDSYLGGHLCIIDLASANKEESEEEEDTEKGLFSLKQNKKRKNK